MGVLWAFLRTFAQLVAVLLFSVVSGYVLCVGKSRTGINLDYGLLAFVCLVVMLFL
jgi:hypothetical protein